uniref:MACRO domain-containing protein 2 n=1 Tax=Hydra vulgaris TaxID=6087 RepID=T2MJL7_HYDVU
MSNERSIGTSTSQIQLSNDLKKPGDPLNNVYSSKYFNLSLDEKRTFYKCGNKFKTLDDIPLWDVYKKIYCKANPSLMGGGGVDGSIHQAAGPTLKKECSTLDGCCSGEAKITSDNYGQENKYPSQKEVNSKVSLWQGDITTLEIDAIVNAANPSLMGGGGVDGSIHQAAGPTLKKECSTLDGCCSGEAKITSGHCLPAKYIIHTVGPVGKNPDLLESCYKNCLQLVLDFEIKTIAFCCISTGIYGYPNKDAAHVALKYVRHWLQEHYNKIDRIIFCTYISKDFEIYKELMSNLYFS